VKAAAAQPPPQPSGYKIPVLKAKPAEGSYIVLKQIESPGLSKVEIAPSTIYMNLYDYFMTLGARAARKAVLTTSCCCTPTCWQRG
jgi:hypothetical protein